MKRIFIIFCFILITIFSSYSQCEIKTLKIDENYSRYSMLEKFYQNADLENGMKTVYIFANAFKDINTRKILLNTLIVTYIYSSYQPAFTSSKCTINFSDGNSLVLIATQKSTNTANEVATPEGIKSIEGIFELTPAEVAKITGVNVSSIYISDIREETTMDITPKFKSILNEMFTCVNK